MDDAHVIVAERSGRVDFLWGFLSLVFAVALVRGHLGAESATGRLAIDLIFGALLAATIGTWIWSRRHPASLTVSRDAVVLSHRGQRRSVTLHRSAGDLYVRRTFIGGKYPLTWLRVTGSDEAISLEMFDLGELEQACVERGWRFVPANAAERA